MFACGHASLDEWLRQRAGQFERRDLARAYVATRSNDSVVLGYYSLATREIAYDALPVDQGRGLPRMNLPVVLIGRLAVDRSMQGNGLGKFLLIDALRRSQKVADEVGVRGVEVDAIDEAARAFYLRFGFTSLRDSPNHLWLAMSVVRLLPQS
jgi:GNAT superfamily N-acetyltransferase